MTYMVPGFLARVHALGLADEVARLEIAERDRRARDLESKRALADSLMRGREGLRGLIHEALQLVIECGYPTSTGGSPPDSRAEPEGIGHP